MDWLTLIGFILFGLLLIIVEIVFVPGTTIVGIVGFLFAGYGVVLAYQNFGVTTGSIVLAGTAVIASGFMIYALKTRSWERFSLKGENNAKFNDENTALELRMKGVSTSSLKPYGKANFDSRIVEVKSDSGFIAEKTEIEIIKIESTKIIVKAITK